MMTDTDFELIHIDQGDANDGIAGVYVVDSSTDVESADDLTWRDRGNGPEVVNDGVYGPFASEAEAEEWIGRYIADLGPVPR